ncbi:MAG: Spy/CpxP family protein refolding chaperone [Candidatus Omnitrophica bacterium]|nr:Spy/CpxP family protein refolding chaperone [Candidatus Omnitrophota bacterium]
MKKINVTIFLLIAALVFAPAMTYAATPAPASTPDKAVVPEKGPMKEKHGKKGQFYKDLNLTEEQQKALEANKSKNRDQMKALGQNMKDKMSLLRQELQKDPLNMEQVNRIEADLKAAQAQMLDQRLASILEVRKILTPEQFKKFMAKMEQKREHFGHKGEGMKGKWKGKPPDAAGNPKPEQIQK